MSDESVQLVVRVAATLDELKRNLAEGKAQIEVTQTALTRMSSAYDGAKTIQQAGATAAAIERIGGVTKLTSDEQARANAVLEAGLAKYRALGQEAPAGMQALADATKKTTPLLGDLEQQLLHVFSVAAITEFGREVLEAGSAIQKMSDQTGLTTDQVQKLNFVAGQTDVSVQSLIGAVQNLQQRLGDDSTGAAGAMAKLRINMDEFNKLDSYDQLTTLSEAIRNVKDPTEQASVSAALFGKTWKEILPAIKAGMEDVGNQAPIMSQATVKALDDIDDAIKRAHTSIVAFGGRGVLAVENLGYAFGDFLSLFDPEHFGRSNDMMLELEKTLNDPDGVKAAFQGLKPPVQDIAKGLQDVTMSASDQRLAIIELTRQSDELRATTDEQTKSEKALADEYDHMSDVVQAVVNQMDALATRKEQELARSADSRLSNNVQTRLQKEIEIYTYMEEHESIYGSALRQQRETIQTLKDSMQDFGDTAVEAFDESTEAAKRFQQASKPVSTQYDLSTKAGRDAVDPKIAVWLHDGWSLAQATAIAFDLAWGVPINQRDPLFANKGPRVPGFGAGKDNVPGGMALVGEYGPEMVRLPKGADVLRNDQIRGAGMGTSIQLTIGPNAIVLNYPLMRDARAVQELGQLLGEGILGKLRAAGLQVPSGV